MLVTIHSAMIQCIMLACNKMLLALFGMLNIYFYSLKVVLLIINLNIAEASILRVHFSDDVYVNANFFFPSIVNSL